MLYFLYNIHIDELKGRLSLMQDRVSVKLRAKELFRAQYWVCVGANVLVAIIVSAASSATFGMAAFFVSPPVTVGLCFFSLSVYRGFNGDIGSVFTNGFTNYLRKLGGMLWMELFVFLWSLLLIIPGIIKSLSYAMTPYILADCPNVCATDALKISMRMMAGHKGELFVYYLSFIGWGILSGLTCGVLYIFYVGPYINNTFAGYYDELKRVSIESGVISLSELDPDARI